MDFQELIQDLEAEWDTGFFAKLRFNGFDLDGFKRVELLLSKLSHETESYPQRLVALTWFIPLFMSWQEAPNLEAQEYRNYCNRLENLVMKGLGMP